ncbi:hypothetical protein AMECASPLE_008208 [Ameca splendens]|uniref:Uncharacterized protein n=1 Tax=Ameca splendens TaxID=208324 RepID=A0ABV0YMC9_9TELE
MMLQCVFRSSCICLLLFSFGACAPARKGQIPSQSGSGAGSGSSGGDSFARGTGSGFAVGGAFSGVGAGSYVGSKAGQDAGISQMIADLLRLSPYDSRPLLQFQWSSPRVPKRMAATRPVFPSSLIVHSDSGYQRARDFRTDSKYTQDIFHHIPKPGTPQSPESGSKEKLSAPAWNVSSSGSCCIQKLEMR